MNLSSMRLRVQVACPVGMAPQMRLTKKKEQIPMEEELNERSILLNLLMGYMYPHKFSQEKKYLVFISVSTVYTQHLWK